MLESIVADADKRYGYKLPADWRTQAEQDPTQFFGHLNSILGPNYPGMSMFTGSKGVVNQDNLGLFNDQLAFNEALKRATQESASGGRDAEEALMGELSSRGLLNSGAAARELGNFREARFQAFEKSATDLNAILYSNASSQAKAEALAAYQSQLSLFNQQYLLNLQYKLQQQLQEYQHRNDLGNLLIGGVTTVLGLGGHPSAQAPNLLGGQNSQMGDFPTTTSTDRVA
jgi:hypothetical protein